MSLLIYNLLLPLALLAMLPGALRKMRRRGGSWRDLRQRLGLFDAPERAALAAVARHEHRYWFHAVSVGEVGVALKIIAPLLDADPETAVVLTVTTPTGRQIALDFAAARSAGGPPARGAGGSPARNTDDSSALRLTVLYSPLDFPFVVRRLLQEIAPRRLVLVEAEAWPNLVTQATRSGIPITLANARLSSKSERRYRRLAWFTRPIFSQLDQVLVQEPADATRWENLGADPSLIHLTGSVKYDPQGSSAPAAATLDHFRALLARAGIEPGRQRLITAASTHPGEERALAETYLDLQRSGNVADNLTLLIVPRHVERAPEILQELAALGLSPILRSTLTPGSPALPFDPSRPLLIDTTGELNAWQHLSDIVIIGKSFLAHGGQNPAEAALARKPVVFGPHMENFEPLIALLLEAGGAVQVPNLEALPAALRALLTDPAQAARTGAAAHAALAKHSGATQRTLEWIGK